MDLDALYGDYSLDDEQDFYASSSPKHGFGKVKTYHEQTAIAATCNTPESSTLTLIKTKQRCRLEVESDLRCALSNIKPNI
uniref:Uncharacterized protein n=1 Tax=Timema bartmani TaxID=61472 RepID=A0A7R9HZN7_9NEOP|nr:unnamed protein product [Timema bartmani]